MIIYGWLGRPTVLAQKQDLCATCGDLLESMPTGGAQLRCKN